MFKPFLTALLALCLTLGTTGAMAAPTAADVEDLACKAGLCQQIDAMHQQMLDSLDEMVASGASKVDPKIVERLRRVADHVYAADRMRHTLMRELSSRLDEHDVPVLLKWFNSPTGRLIARAEQAMPDADPSAPAVKGAEALDASSAVRRGLLADILRESRAAEASADIIINTTLAVRGGVVLASPGMPAGDTRELRATLERNRAAMIRSFAQVSLPILAGSYANVSDDELTSYLEFMKSEQGARFNEISILSFESALLTAASEFGKAIPGARQGQDA